MRVWRLLTQIKRLGQAHGFDLVFLHRPNGSIVVYCPVCPERGVNMEHDWERTPAKFLSVISFQRTHYCKLTYFRHTNQGELTLDGNHHANQMAKNNDPNDVSLSYGHSYFPERNTFDEYLKLGESLKGHHKEVSLSCVCQPSSYSSVYRSVHVTTYVQSITRMGRSSKICRSLAL